MVAADAFIEQLWSLWKWHIGYAYLKGRTWAMVPCPYVVLEVLDDKGWSSAITLVWPR